MSSRKPEEHQHRRKFFVSKGELEGVHQCECGAMRISETSPWRNPEAFALEHPISGCEHHRESQSLRWTVGPLDLENLGGSMNFPVCACGLVQDPTRSDWTDFEHMVRRYPPKGETAEQILARWPSK